MADIMPKAQYEFVSKVKNDMMINTNMTEDEAWDFGFRCWQMGYAKVERKTNADRIRNMTDEELAEFFARKSPCDYYCNYSKRACNGVSCKQGILDWLKSPTTD